MTQQETDEVEYDVFSGSCPSRPTLEHVTGRWGTLTLGALETGPLRFNALLRRVEGISQKMLAQTLLALERDGFVHRESLPTAGLHVEYRLTPLGRDTVAQLSVLIDLLESRMPEVLAAQRHFDQTRTGA
ncbi:helix-turn-helix domain-containing protein [Kineosporia sp. NBRC 101731]|uniref:winged helix-turn-helix transcriptional regulator n=1 Tax=Kineosporia sp. NBRC 101731 TaxID=3032199 RepID=UPI0024A60A69|nr:helix-turn-helix domain-containing protein [Kineosporia sp. NBRC 101731]GLY29746.1 HxlR family transcriptional regulator [Kineosporia sp. NBRC 101731]